MRFIWRVWGSSTAVCARNGDKTRSSITRDEGSRHRRALGVYKWDSARPHARHLGLCGRRGGEIMRPRAQTGESPQVRFQLRLSGARKMVLANLRVQHGPLVATLVEGHHEGALHAACGRSRVPGVMTTTLYALTLKSCR